MNSPGIPWKNEEERRAHFIQAFNMAGRPEKEIDEAMVRLKTYVRLILEAYYELDGNQREILHAQMKEGSGRPARQRDRRGDEPLGGIRPLGDGDVWVDREVGAPRSSAENGMGG